MIKAGSEVFVVYDDTRRGTVHAKVKCIGRKYITLENMHISEARYDINTHKSIDDSRGWNCNATLYESEEQYKSLVFRKLCENMLRKNITEYVKRANFEQLEELNDFINDKQK